MARCAYCWRWRRLPFGRLETGASFTSFSRWRRGWQPIPARAPNPGWERWVKSWCLDFISTYEIYWNVPWDKLDVSELPNRAFDSAGAVR